MIKKEATTIGENCVSVKKIKNMKNKCTRESDVDAENDKTA